MPPEQSDRRADWPATDVEVPLSSMASSRELHPERDHDASLGELFRRLTSDTTDLLRQEVELAKAEVRETGERLARAATAIGIGAGLALAGALTLTAALVLILGLAFGGRYWLSALLVGGAALGIGIPMITRALHAFSASALVPRQTVDTLREDAQWARQEARAFTQELTTSPSDAASPTSPRP
jgi:uncharacterized membrane protein YqjE